MIKVANIIEEGKLGGPQIRIANVAHKLFGTVETTVILPIANSANFISKLEELGVPYRLFPLSKITKELKPLLRYIFFSVYEIILLVKYFRKNNFDLVHVSGGSWQYKGVISSYIAGQKVIWHLNDTKTPLLFRKLFTFFSRFSNGYIYASNRSKLYYSPFIKLTSKKPSFVIQAPVDTALFNPSLDFKGDEKLIEQFANKIVIGTVANINPVKGLETFIESIIDLNKRYDNLEFLIIGPIYNNQKRYYNYLQKRINKNNINNISFVGPRRDVKPLLKRIDIYVCSSKFESSPIAVWEAMSMMKAIVSSNVGDVSLFITMGYNGAIVETNNSVKLTKKVSELIINNKLRLRYGLRSREIAITNLDISNCAEKHLKAYKQILHNVK